MNLDEKLAMQIGMLVLQNAKLQVVNESLTVNKRDLENSVSALTARLASLADAGTAPSADAPASRPAEDAGQ